MNEEQFIQHLQEKGISLSPGQLAKFDTYYDLLIEWNKKMNLTAITEKKEVYLKHFYDSITASFYVPFQGSLNICDVGAGAGFPSLPIKIVFPEIQVTIVDSLNKRIQFLQHLTNELHLENVRFFHDRAETFGQREENREAFDLVLARAVARLSVLSELCLPLTKVGGTFIAMKGAHAEEEIESGKKAVKMLGGKLEKTYSFLLPFEESERNILLIKKVKKTPKKFPRKPGIPNKTPIE